MDALLDFFLRPPILYHGMITIGAGDLSSSIFINNANVVVNSITQDSSRCPPSTVEQEMMSTVIPSVEATWLPKQVMVVGKAVTLFRTRAESKPISRDPIMTSM